MAEGGDDEIGLHGAGDFCAVVVRSQGEEIAEDRDEEKQDDGLNEGEERLVRSLGGEDLLGGGLIDEEAGDGVDGAAVDEGLEQIGGGGDEGEQTDDRELALVILGQAEEGFYNSLERLGGGFSGHTLV